MGYPINDYHCYACMTPIPYSTSNYIDRDVYCYKCREKYKYYNMKEITKLILEPHPHTYNKVKTQNCIIL